MLTDTITRLLTSKPSKIIMLLVIVVAAVTQLVPQMVDTKPYTDQLATSVREVTGGAMVIKQGGKFQFLPRPALVLADVEISQPGVHGAPTIGTKMMEVGIDMLALLQGKLRVDALRLYGLATTIEHKEDDKLNLGFLGLATLKILAATKPEHPVKLEIYDGSISLADMKKGSAETLGGIHAAGVWGEQSELSGSVLWNEKPLHFAFSRRGAVGATPFEMTLRTDGADAVSLKGEVDFTADHPLISGKLAAKLADATAMITGLPTVEGSSPTPFTLSADYTQKEGWVALSNMVIEGFGSKATGSLTASGEQLKDRVLTLAFSALDLSALRPVVATLAPTTEEGTRTPSPLFDKNLRLHLNITADQVVSGGEAWKEASFTGEIAEGHLAINKLALRLPGDSTLSLFGVASVNEAQGLRFEGSVEAEGKSLRDTLGVLDASAANLPALGFGAFNLRSTLFISSELLRLSEAEAKFSDLSFKGGLVGYFDKSKPRIEAELALRDVDFDYFRNHWRETVSPDTAESFLRFDRGMNFDWLKKLAASIDFKMQVKGFTFLERKGQEASLRLFAQAGEVGVYNARFDYGNDVAEGNLKLDVTKDEPHINIVLNTRTLDTNYFARVPKPAWELPSPKVITPEMKVEDKPVEPLPEMTMPEITPEEELRANIAEEAKQLEGAGETSTSAVSEPVALTPADTVIRTEPQAAEEVAEDRLENNPVDMSMIEGIGGNFDISVGTLMHRGRMLQNFKMLATLERNLLTFKTLTFGHFGGSFSVNGTVFGGKVPGMSLGFIIASADISQLTEQLLRTSALGGRISMSGTVDTSGVDTRSWAEQANAKLTFAARGVTIRGFDVASVVGAVNASRTAADVFNNVNLSLGQGAGEYSADGAINIQKAVVSTPGIALNTGRIVGNITGDLELLPWQMRVTGLFKFPELSPENVPTMTVQISGPPEQPALQTDTQSLEALASKRIIGD